MLKKMSLLVFSILIFTSVISYAGSGNKFPWRKKWNRHELYRMATYYYEAGQAFKKHNKNDKAMHCFKHANKTSPYSDVGAKSRKELRDNYNKDIPEPTTGELVSWLKKQDDLTAEEKEFINQYEKNQAGPGTNKPEPGTGNQTGPGTNKPEPGIGSQATSKTDITEQEIKKRGEKIKYRDDSAPSGGQ